LQNPLTNEEGLQQRSATPLGRAEPYVPINLARCGAACLLRYALHRQ